MTHQHTPESVSPSAIETEPATPKLRKRVGEYALYASAVVATAVVANRIYASVAGNIDPLFDNPWVGK